MSIESFQILHHILFKGKRTKQSQKTKAKQQTEQTQRQIFHFTACRSCAALKFTDIQRQNDSDFVHVKCCSKGKKKIFLHERI